MFSLWQNNGITWLDIPAFRRTGLVEHAFSTKLGGVSPYPWQGLNLGIYTKDDPRNIQENRERFIERFAIEAKQVSTLQQIHSTRVLKITSKQRGNDYLEPSSTVVKGDGMVTNEKNIALFINFADCVPLLFLDPIREVVAAVHAGWRGTVSGIGVRTIESMKKWYGTNPEDILVGIGPSNGPLDFEVGSEVIEEVKAHFPAWTELLLPTRPNHALFDLWLANSWQLQSQGVKPEHIYISGLSTQRRTDLFYSHRKSIMGDTGRMGCFIMLK